MGRTSIALLADQSLSLHADAESWPLVRPWLPLNCDAAPDEPEARARISIEPVHSEPGARRPNTPSALHLGQVHLWLDEDDGTALLCGATRSVGRIDLVGLEAQLDVDLGAGSLAQQDLYSMLTLSSALLLGRIGRTLIHAAAFATPDGRSWLIVGDGGSGKSTTCIGLARDGNQLLSDDQVVLSTVHHGVTVEGWVRPLHLDEGWEAGVPTGRRRTVEPSDLGLALSQRVGNVVGTLHTAVAAEQPTSVVPISAAKAFAGLVRQAPWLLVDRDVAESIVALLSEAARLPSYALSLGLDTYGRRPKLRALLDSALA